MLITGIRQTSPGRLTVGLDDGSEVKTTLGVVTDMRLYAGRELDGEAVNALKTASARALARERAIEYVSRRAMSRAELKKKLIEKGEDEDTAEYCAAWLAEHSLIDDERYAAAVARHYAAKGYGAGRVRAELSRRGIDRELWDGAVGAMPAGDGKIDKFISSRLHDPDDRDEVRKLSQALYRRGYSWEEIRSALERHRRKYSTINSEDSYGQKLCTDISGLREESGQQRADALPHERGGVHARAGGGRRRPCYCKHLRLY